MILKKVLKYILIFSCSMTILHIIPNNEIDCTDKYYITLAFCCIYLLLEISLPSYKIEIQDNDLKSIS